MENDLKQQFNELQLKLEQISKDVIKLTIINEHLYEERQASSSKLEKLEGEFTVAKGAISTLKWIATLFATSAIAFCAWIVTSNREHYKEISQLNHRIVVVEKELYELKSKREYEKAN